MVEMFNTYEKIIYENFLIAVENVHLALFIKYVAVVSKLCVENVENFLLTQIIGRTNPKKEI